MTLPYLTSPPEQVARAAHFVRSFPSNLRPVKTYVSRPLLFGRLEEQLFDGITDGNTRVSVVLGATGTGKTQLVLDYVRQHRTTYQAIFWIKAENEESLKQGFNRLRRSLFDVQSTDVDGTTDLQSAVLSVKNWLFGRGGLWLMVFDDCNTNIQHFIPNTSSLHAIVITRNSALTKDLKVVRVGRLEEAYAMELFYKCSQLSFDNKDVEENIQLIVKELKCFALAVAQAAAYVRETPRLRSSVSEFLPEYRAKREELLTRERNVPTVSEIQSLFTLFEMSFQALAEQQPEASTLLTMLCFLDSDDISLQLFDQIRAQKAESNTSTKSWWHSRFPQLFQNIGDIRSWFAILERYSLVRRNEQEQTYTMHKSVQTYGRMKLTKEQHHEFSIAALELISETTHQDIQTRSDKARIGPHAMAISVILMHAGDLSFPHTEQTVRKLAEIGLFMSEIGRIHDAHRVGQYVLDENQRIFGPDHPSSISAQENLALTFRNLGQFEQAINMQREALERANHVLGEGNPVTISALDSLASIFRATGRLQEAASIKAELLKRKRRMLGDQHSSTLAAIEELATTLEALGDLDQVVRLRIEVIDVMKVVFGEDHTDTIKAMTNLVPTLRSLGRLNEAVKIQTEAMEKRKGLAGEEHPDTISVINDLVAIFGDLEMFGQAIELLETVIELMKRILGEIYPRIKVTISNSNFPTESKVALQLTSSGSRISPKTNSAIFEIDPAELNPADKLVVVLGPAGAGKTHFIQTVTGDSTVNAEISDKTTTNKLNTHRTEIDGRSVILVDTVSFDNASRTDASFLQALAVWLARIYDEKSDLVRIVYMHDIRNPTISGHIATNVWMLKELVGEEGLRGVTLVTNRWETIPVEIGEKRLLDYSKDDGMWGVMVRNASATERYSGTTKDARRILRSVIGEKPKVALKIQEELMDHQLELAETNAGKTLLEVINNLRSIHMRALTDLQVKMNEAVKARDFKLCKLIAEQQLTTMVRLKEYSRQVSDIKSQDEAIEELRKARDKELKLMTESFENHVASSELQRASPSSHFGYEVQDASYSQSDERRTSPNETMMDFHAVVVAVRLLWQVSQRVIRRRPPVGYKRLEWKCTCGELLYGDFKETTPGSLERLAARLKQYNNQDTQQGSQGFPPASSKEQSRHKFTKVGYNMPGGSQDSSLDDPFNSMTASSSISGTQPQRALQLCVETGRFTIELCELNWTQPHSDGVLFERMRQKYEQARRSIFPMRLRFSKPSKAIFIQFRLGKRPFVSPITGTIETPSIPSEEEVRAENYIYIPCPIDEPPIDNRTFFHHFYAPASQHTDSMWGERLPWKLGPGLAPMVPGWGIHLEESPDWPLFAAFMFLCLLASGIVAGVYSWKSGDRATGVAIGAWLTAVQTMGMTAVFFWRR